MIPHENIFDKRERLINEGKLTVCGYHTPFAPVYSTCRQEVLTGKRCYYHTKVHAGLLGTQRLTQAYRALA